jgi:DNA invertase Pin-like site-specific DNA recombinase
MRKITKIEPTLPDLPKRKKVAAYARVSVGKDRAIHSLSAQVSHYSEFIQKNPEWEYVGVYADLGETGTSDNRAEWKRLLADCEDGKIDIVLTKSISRFARNTVDLLETVRHLRELNIEVRFEKESINSLSGDGELMLSILASFAQEESRSLSENVKWGIRKGFKEGKTNSFYLYGYRWNGEKFIIQPEEAKVVKLIYENFLKNISAEQTAKQLTEMGVKSYFGRDEFSATSVRAILRNDKYTGVLRLQKTYVENHITHKYMVNKGELPMYIVEDAHEAIISKEMFQAVQDEQARRRELGVFANWSINTTEFTSKIKCGKCGQNFHRKSKRSTTGIIYKLWCCASKDKKGAVRCAVKNIREDILRNVSAEVCGLSEFDEKIFAEKISQITVIENNKLIFHLNDGTEVEKEWHSTAKKDCWTPEARKAAAERMRARNADGRWSPEKRKQMSNNLKKRYEENPDWNNRRQGE